MPELVFTDAFVSVDGVDLSDHVRQATLTYQGELADNTPMGLGTRRRIGGLKDWSVDLEFNQDFAAASVDDTLFPLVGTAFVVILRPVNTGGVSATNPNYTGTGILESYSPLGGAVGEEAKAPCTIQAAGTLNRAVV